MHVRAGKIFINEIHYDNYLTDFGEKIEVVMPAGVVASTLSLYLYNGANPSAATVYTPTVALPAPTGVSGGE